MQGSMSLWGQVSNLPNPSPARWKRATVGIPCSPRIAEPLMPMPVRHLTVLQNWDCHVCGTCCKEYPVAVTDEERRRIEEQHWEKEPGFQGIPLFKTASGLLVHRQELNRRADGSCVFLSERGRCRIHEKFGPEGKPLPCRLFPFLLVPAGDHWRVGVRFACPSAAANKGRPLTQHDSDLETFAALLAAREGMPNKPSEANLPPPEMQAGQRVTWPDLMRFANVLLTILRAPGERMERRLRKCLTLDRLCRQARFEKIDGTRLDEFLKLVVSSLDGETPADPATLAAPSWLGRLLFRQNLALFARKDQGPDRGLAAQGRLALLRAGWRFARGRGSVPRVNGRMPDATFDQVEALRRPPSPESEEMLERYYLTKIGSLQFCGVMNHGLPFWDGFEVLAATFPVICWLTRLFAGLPALEATQRAVSMVDDHFGFNTVLGTRRQRLGFRIMVRTGELDKLIAWYGR
jgi:lysine-N-methylase